MMGRKLMRQCSGGPEPEEVGRALEKMEWVEKVEGAWAAEPEPLEVVWTLEEWVW